MDLINDIGDTFNIDVRLSSKQLLEITTRSEDDYELIEMYEDFIVGLLIHAGEKYKGEISLKDEEIKELKSQINDLKTFNEY